MTHHDPDPDLDALPFPPLDPAFAARVRDAAGTAYREAGPRPGWIELVMAAALVAPALVTLVGSLSTMVRIFVVG